MTAPRAEIAIAGGAVVGFAVAVILMLLVDRHLDQEAWFGAVCVYIGAAAGTAVGVLGIRRGWMK